jgi:hypothetical protein
MSRSKPKVKVSPRERQMLLDFLQTGHEILRVMYVDIADIERKPPSPDKGPKLLAMKAMRSA